LVGVVTGCAAIPKGQIAGGSTDYNLAVEKAQNEMLLLNIVRASKRHPMYFTVLNDVKASMVYTLSTGPAYIPLGKFGSNPGSTSLYSIAPNATYTTNPLFDVALLNSKDFVRGMLESVKPDTFDYYWQQGWPKEMLLYLFIHRIQKGRHTYKNNPFDETFGDFQKEIERIADNECDLVVTEVPPGLIGPEITAELAAADLQKLIELHKAGLTLTPAQKTREKIATYQLKSLKQGEYAIECRTGRDGNVSARYKVLPDSPVQNVADRTAEANIYLRSPETILYYLGQILRAEKIADDKIAKPPKLKGGKDRPCEPWLFVAREAGAEDTNPFVAVDYEGTKYVIPRTDSEKLCPEDLSTYVLSLVSLLTAKQSASDLPAPTGVVTTIGR
jgi:hypothetical protein